MPPGEDLGIVVLTNGPTYWSRPPAAAAARPLAACTGTYANG
ncbi:hypothetical protein [Streptomyces sp. ATMOS53]